MSADYSKGIPKRHVIKRMEKPSTLWGFTTRDFMIAGGAFFLGAKIIEDRLITVALMGMVYLWAHHLRDSLPENYFTNLREYIKRQLRNDLYRSAHKRDTAWIPPIIPD